MAISVRELRVLRRQYVGRIRFGILYDELPSTPKVKGALPLPWIRAEERVVGGVSRLRDGHIAPMKKFEPSSMTVINEPDDLLKWARRVLDEGVRLVGTGGELDLGLRTRVESRRNRIWEVVVAAAEILDAGWPPTDFPRLDT